MNILSHEVRTPINGIVNLTEYFEMSLLASDELRDVVEMMGNQCGSPNNVVMNM